MGDDVGVGDEYFAAWDLPWNRAGEAFQDAGGQVGCVVPGWQVGGEGQDLLGVPGREFVAGGQVGNVVVGLGCRGGGESCQVGEGLVGGLCGAWRGAVPEGVGF